MRFRNFRETVKRREKPTKVWLHRLWSLSILLAVILLPIAVTAAQQQPSQIINRFNTALLESMKKSSELGYKGRYDLLAPVIKESFNLPFMARVASGRYWAAFSDDERKKLLNKYSDWSIANYAGSFDGYSGEQFKVVSESSTAPDAITVVSKLIKSNKDEVEFHYQFRKVNDVWRIVDIRISGVSQLALTRSQFVEILSKKRFNGLVSLLDEKIGKLSQGKGE